MDYAPRILIVDDEHDVRTLFERVLSEDGYYVSAVPNARQAREALSQVCFQVLILDLSLPDADGVELLREVRTEFPYVRVLATSGFLVGNMPEIVMAAGASGTLCKPTTPRDLKNQVYRILDFGEVSNRNGLPSSSARAARSS